MMPCVTAHVRIPTRTDVPTCMSQCWRSIGRARDTPVAVPAAMCSWALAVPMLSSAGRRGTAERMRVAVLISLWLLGMAAIVAVTVYKQ